MVARIGKHLTERDARFGLLSPAVKFSGGDVAVKPSAAS